MKGVERPQGIKRKPFSAERSLWAAVLARALRDVEGTGLEHDYEIERDCHNAKKDAEMWFREDSWDVAGVRWVCNVLGIPWDVVRKYIAAKRENNRLTCEASKTDSGRDSTYAKVQARLRELY